MGIDVTDVGLVVSKLVEQLKNDPVIRDMSVTVDRSAEGDNPSRCPWLCVYRFGARLPPRTLGVAPGFRRHNVDLAIVAQHSDATSGEQCEIRLEKLVKAALDALLNDTTIGGTVQQLGEEIFIQYPDFRLTSEGQYMQTAVINFTALGVVNVT